MNDRGGTLSYSARQTPNRRPNKNKKTYRYNKSCRRKLRSSLKHFYYQVNLLRQVETTNPIPPIIANISITSTITSPILPPVPIETEMPSEVRL